MAVRASILWMGFRTHKSCWSMTHDDASQNEKPYQISLDRIGGGSQFQLTRADCSCVAVGVEIAELQARSEVTYEMGCNSGGGGKTLLECKWTSQQRD